MTIKAGIIAAGAGSRLAKSHPDTVKPLIGVSGKPLIHWVVDGLRDRYLDIFRRLSGGELRP